MGEPVSSDVDDLDPQGVRESSWRIHPNPLFRNIFWPTQGHPDDLPHTADRSGPVHRLRGRVGWRRILPGWLSQKRGSLYALVVESA